MFIKDHVHCRPVHNRLRSYQTCS